MRDFDISDEDSVRKASRAGNLNSSHRSKFTLHPFCLSEAVISDFQKTTAGLLTWLDFSTCTVEFGTFQWFHSATKGQNEKNGIWS